ncbi:MAG: hypothetical protein ABQ298_06255 [Puniceicoccaceae bacterium]
MNLNLNDFLKANGLDATRHDFDREVSRFQEAMDAGLQGKESSLRMLPTFVGVPEDIQPNHKVLAIDLGGTNLRAGLIGFDANAEASVLELRKRKMPGHDTRVGRDEVFDAIAELTVDWLDQTEQVGFCFSNAFEFQENGDAKVLHFGKELQVDGMVGSLLIENLRAAWVRKGSTREVKVVVLNDTVSTLLMGKLLYPRRKVSDFIGFILGTGMNISYLEANECITKLNNFVPGRKQVINTECGDYAGFEQSHFDKLLDATTTNQGHYLMEKTMSGAFVGRLVAVVINEAVKQGCVKSAVPERLSTKHVNDFLLGKGGSDNPLIANCEANAANFEDYFTIINEVLKRAAKFAAIALVATATRSGSRDNFSAPLLLSIDGSSYAGEYFYRERIEAYLWKHLRKKHGICFQIIRPENASLLGASVAALGSQLG